ncbi:MAG TPA: type II toxin-antitoxin system RelE/ParE family toxin [Thermoanaerobaculia bacterium]|nr:type II toxin-antitoxin system RelE/ParE family toxin [Thermoanaerobaculia bacterium]
MSPRLPLQITRRATREIQSASEWWDENRPAAPDAFRDAIEKAFELIRTQPDLGAVAANVRLSGVRRIHLSRVRYHLYYRVKDNTKAIEVVALWHTSRYPDLDL